MSHHWCPLFDCDRRRRRARYELAGEDIDSGCEQGGDRQNGEWVGLMIRPVEGRCAPSRARPRGRGRGRLCLLERTIDHGVADEGVGRLSNEEGAHGGTSATEASPLPRFVLQQKSIQRVDFTQMTMVASGIPLDLPPPTDGHRAGKDWATEIAGELDCKRSRQAWLSERNVRMGSSFGIPWSATDLWPTTRKVSVQRQ